MFKELNVFKIAYSMATHAGKRQALVAQNIANADTPGYNAKDIKPFKEVYEQRARPGDMIASRANHLNGGSGADMNWAVTEQRGGGDPNDNSVSLEAEILKGVEVKRQHDRALAIYKSSMKVLRASLGKN
ncbi:FlgB family protein [Phaeobacter italicus]|uniref:FlgB family protein n=1 Tax=Phaeobacter italicus TaxID=481446 RepID=UPI000186FBE2|nr:FlgB family protein [Phaeobacter italicus]EEB72769.1 flagellar basal-body rod protein; FlgB [Ruegeria sp. R11]CRL15761.1 flagellar basal body rod protein FlgB [Phaeobacter italicus]SFG69012.1 flagellar basal-body rod protein FlgB [Phaeobacter italicus]